MTVLNIVGIAQQYVCALLCNTHTLQNKAGTRVCSAHIVITGVVIRFCFNVIYDDAPHIATASMTTKAAYATRSIRVDRPAIPWPSLLLACPAAVMPSLLAPPRHCPQLSPGLQLTYRS